MGLYICPACVAATTNVVTATGAITDNRGLSGVMAIILFRTAYQSRFTVCLALYEAQSTLLGVCIANAQGACVSAGVNPMITTESIAYMVGEGMAAKYSKLLKRRSPVELQYET